MVANKAQQLSRDAWLNAALELTGNGIDQIKVAPLAKDLGVTTGSFYWHFKNRQELLDSVLEYWEKEMTDAPIASTSMFRGDPKERILVGMQTVISKQLARYDRAIWLWAQSDSNAEKVFRRALQKRFDYSTWMFEEAGFSKKQAEARGLDALAAGTLAAEPTTDEGRDDANLALLQAQLAYQLHFQTEGALR